MAMVSEPKIKTQIGSIQAQPSVIVTNSMERMLIKISVLVQFFRIAINKTGNPIRALAMIRTIRQKYLSTFGEPLLTKVTKVAGRYYWRLGAAGFPSTASYLMHENEINRFIPSETHYGLRTLIFAITKQCPLHCEHCFEWDNLNQKDELTADQIIEIVHKYQDYGTTQILLSGGEPMLRINDVYKVLKAAKVGTDFWLITSGLGLNEDRAKRLKAYGLTGVIVSLDHFESSEHDRFRGFEGAYHRATQAVVHANAAGLVTTLSLCVTKTFLSKPNLLAYMELAKKLGASFVQILEPRAFGKYAGQAVELNADHFNMLEEFYLTYNGSKQHREYPIVNYLGYHQRKVGCFGGDRFFYIDADGDAHVCPFCSDKIGSAVLFPAKDIINLLSEHQCIPFKPNKLI